MRTIGLSAPETIVPMTMDAPTPRADELLIRNLACGVCGGDIKNFKSPRSKEISPAQPMPLGGHEFAGEVAAVGAEVKGFSVGDRVVHVFNNYCGFCQNCRLGYSNFCLNFRRTTGGGFAEYSALYAGEFGRGVFQIPEYVSLEEAATCEPLTCAIGATLKVMAQPGERIAVIGLGGLGQFIAQILASAKASVIGIDQQPDKLRVAAQYCHAVIDASHQDVVAETLALTGNVGVDAVVEVVGITETFKQAIEVSRMGGRIVIAGVHPKAADGIHIDRIFRKELTIQTTKGAAPLRGADGVPLAFRYIEEGIARPLELLAPFAIEDAQAAFMGQAHGSVIKAVLVQ